MYIVKNIGSTASTENRRLIQSTIVATANIDPIYGIFAWEKNTRVYGSSARYTIWSNHIRYISSNRAS